MSLSSIRRRACVLAALAALGLPHLAQAQDAASAPAAAVQPKAVSVISIVEHPALDAIRYGVKEELAEAVFHKGVSTGGSTGYGLAIARQLADADGGTLELTQLSPPVFSLTLAAVPDSFAPEKVLPAGSLLTMGARRRRR